MGMFFRAVSVVDKTGKLCVAIVPHNQSREHFRQDLMKEGKRMATSMPTSSNPRVDGAWESIYLQLHRDNGAQVRCCTGVSELLPMQSLVGPDVFFKLQEEQGCGGYVFVQQGGAVL